jgi:quercetin dioxygenase-like cupin family protein
MYTLRRLRGNLPGRCIHTPPRPRPVRCRPLPLLRLAVPISLYCRLSGRRDPACASQESRPGAQTMTQPYLFFDNLASHADLPPDGILSRTLHADDKTKILQFCFAAGTELSAHTALVPAMLYFVRGEAELQLGEDRMEAREGSLAFMPPRLEHAIRARTETVMLLVMFREPSQA